MNEKTKATAIGSFVILTLALAIGLIFWFAPKEQLNTQDPIILYFKGDLTGLQIGSSVVYRGIKVGEVSDIKLVLDPKTHEFVIPVWMQFIRNVVEDPAQLTKERKTLELKRMIREGLRAQLSTSNIVTGELKISLVKRPNSLIQLHDTKYFEIPTVEAETKEVLLRHTLNTAKQSFEDFSEFLKSKQLLGTISQTGNTFDKTGKLIDNINNRINPLITQVSDAINEIQKSAHAFRIASEYLSRHPESLVTGKPKHR